MLQTTHDVRVGADTVCKRYRGVLHGEDQREWDALVLLAEHRPGLASEPLRRRSSSEVVVVLMSRVAGQPLGIHPVTDIELRDSLGPTVVATRPCPHRCSPPRPSGRARRPSC